MKALKALVLIALLAAAGCGSGEYVQSKEPVSVKGANNRNKALVVYYTRTGNTKAVAEALRETYDADLQEIKDLKDRSGVFGFIGGMIDVKKKDPRTDILPKAVDLKGYDAVIICSPTWGMRFAPAITTFMESADFAGKKVLFTAVATSKMKDATFDAMGAAVEAKGGKPAGSMLVKTIFKKPEQIQEETKKLVKENPAFTQLQPAD